MIEKSQLTSENYAQYLKERSQAAYLNQQKIKAAKTNFRQLFNEEILPPATQKIKPKPTVIVLKKRPYRQA